MGATAGRRCTRLRRSVAVGAAGEVGDLIIDEEKPLHLP
jgi:hypothetical protein